MEENQQIFQIRKKRSSRRSNFGIFVYTCFRIFFIFAKNNPKVKCLKIFRHEFLYTAYADDTTFFLKVKDKKSIIELINELNTFSNFSGLKPDKKKCEIVGIGALNGVVV